MLYAEFRISRKINELTKKVENPQLFKESKFDKSISGGGRQHLDEIDRLEYIFANFYNEEKGKGSESQHITTKGNIDKKVSMLPMKSSINIYNQQQEPSDLKKQQDTGAHPFEGEDPVIAMLKNDLGIEIEKQKVMNNWEDD